MRNNIIRKGQTKQKRGINLISTIGTLALIVQVLSNTTSAIAGKKGNGEIIPNISTGEVIKNTEDLKKLKKIGLNESQISQIIAIQRQIEIEKASGKLSKDFEMRISDKTSIKLNTNPISVPSNPKDDFTPIEAKPKNKNVFFTHIFDKNTSNNFINKLTKLSNEKREELKQDIYSRNLMILTSLNKDIGMFGEGFIYNWFEKFNKTTPQLKHKNILNYQKLLELTYLITKFQFMSSKNLTLKQLNSEEINKLEVYYALQATLYLLENKDIKFVKINFISKKSQDTNKELANIFIIGEDGFDIFDISTTKTIGILQDCFLQSRRENIDNN